SQRDLPLLDRPEIKGVTIANADVTFAVPATFGRARVELAHVLIEGRDVFFAREFTTDRWRPFALIPAGEDEMRPFLRAGLRDREQVHARVGMTAVFGTLDAESRGDFFEPAEIEWARKSCADFVRPIAEAIRDFDPMLRPVQSAAGRFSFFE